MKIIAILLCSLCFVSYTLVRADSEEAKFSCLRKVGVTLADVPRLLRDDSDEGIRQRGCIEACYMQKMGIMDGNTIVMEKIDEQIDKFLANSDNKENVRESVHQCAAGAADGDECVVAQKFAKCGFEDLRLRVQNVLQQWNQ